MRRWITPHYPILPRKSSKGITLVFDIFYDTHRNTHFTAEMSKRPFNRYLRPDRTPHHYPRLYPQPTPECSLHLTPRTSRPPPSRTPLDREQARYQFRHNRILTQAKNRQHPFPFPSVMTPGDYFKGQAIPSASLSTQSDGYFPRCWTGPRKGFPFRERRRLEIRARASRKARFRRPISQE